MIWMSVMVYYFGRFSFSSVCLGWGGGICRFPRFPNHHNLAYLMVKMRWDLSPICENIKRSYQIYRTKSTESSEKDQNYNYPREDTKVFIPQDLVLLHFKVYQKTNALRNYHYGRSFRTLALQHTILQNISQNCCLLWASHNLQLQVQNILKTVYT